MTAAQLVANGYPGYNGWGDAEANADFNATHGAGKTGGGSGGGGGGATPVSSADLAGIRDTVFNTLKPYYVQLLKEAQGDYNRAVAKLQEDYVTNTRNDRIAYAFTNNQGKQEMQNTLSQLGITNLSDQIDTIDSLNKRGMAVYQNNPDGTPNALSTSGINSNTNLDVKPGDIIDNSSTIANPANANMGEGGYELAQLQNKQRLQQEAQQRAITKPIEQAGITLKKQTNLPAGIDPNQSADKLATALSAPGVDRSQLGSEEQGLVTGQETQARGLQQTQEGLGNELSNDLTNTSSQLANTSDKAAGSVYTNSLLNDTLKQFINTGA